MSIGSLKISKVYISTIGDMSVGMPCESATLVSDGDFLINLLDVDEDDRSVVLESFRQRLKETFEMVWEDNARVLFDFEIAAID